jgi:NAD+ diphosphatase
VLYGTALMEWKRRNIYCSNCGSIDVSYQENGGTVGQCQNCQTKFWPRQDPSIIVLIVSNDRQRVLLANHVRHQHKKIYTTLAGFVEVGESMESAVVREVYEETGIRVDTTKPMQYIGTQPWPFPQSCMIGFIATADDRNQQITIDPAEIYDAQWFSKEDILAATTVLGSTLQTQVTEKAFQENPNLSCVIPPKGVIARKLIDTWLLEGNDRQQLKNDTSATADAPKSSFLHDDTATANQEEPVVHRIRII